MFQRLRAVALIAPFALLAGTPSLAQTPPVQTPPPAAAKPVIGKPNPAAVNCKKLGGVSEITVNKRGDEYGWCKLPSGKVCEEWALLQDKACIERKN